MTYPKIQAVLHLSHCYISQGHSQPIDLWAQAYKFFGLITLLLVINYALLGWAKKRKTTKCRWGQCVLVMRGIFRMCCFVCFTGSISWKWKSATLTTSRKVGYALGCRVRARSVQTILLQRSLLRKIWEIKSYNEYDHIAFYAFQYIPIIFSGSPSECWLHTCRAWQLLVIKWRITKKLRSAGDNLRRSKHSKAVLLRKFHVIHSQHTVYSITSDGKFKLRSLHSIQF